MKWLSELEAPVRAAGWLVGGFFLISVGVAEAKEVDAFSYRPEVKVVFDSSPAEEPDPMLLHTDGPSDSWVTPGALAVSPDGRLYESDGGLDRSVEGGAESVVSDFFAGTLQGWEGVGADVFSALDASGPFEHAEYPLKRIKNSTAYPFRTVGQLDSGCSATLIGPRHVLTAGHCVYDIKTNAWKNNVAFTPGRNGNGEKPYGTIAWTRVIAPKGWTQDHRQDHDYAMIILSDKVGDRVGWMSYGYDSGLSKGTNIIINSYPGNRPAGTMWQSGCPIRDAGSETLSYLCSIDYGSSGSSIYVFHSDKNTRVIYGVHAYGGTANSGARLTKGKYEALHLWKTQNP